MRELSNTTISSNTNRVSLSFNPFFSRKTSRDQVKVEVTA